MTHTVLPSVKGQVTIPAPIREKYHIGQETPMIIEDKGKGILTIKIMRVIPDDGIEEYETKTERGLRFKYGIDPKTLIEAIKKIDG